MVVRRREVIVGLIIVAGLFLIGIIAARSFGESDPLTAEVAGARIVQTTTTAVATTSSTTTTEPPTPLRNAVLAFTGDTLAHRGVVRQARAFAVEAGAEGYEFGPMFDQVRPYIEGADLAICHLETPLSPDDSNLSGYPTFNVPGDLASDLAEAGYDGCSTASNHSLDRSTDGVTSTLDVLDAAGLKHSGMARNEHERAKTTLYDAAGITVANLSYSYGFNGFTVAADESWLVNEIDVPTIVADVARAESDGAEYVVVSLHWGTEYRLAPNEQQLDVAAKLEDIDDIDLIIGHHAHVVQPVEEGPDRFVVYGLGNFLSNQSAICCVAGSQDGLIMQVHVQDIRLPDGSVDGFRTWLTYIPTWVDRDDFTIVPVLDALATDDESTSRTTLLSQSRERTKAALTGMGAALVEASP